MVGIVAVAIVIVVEHFPTCIIMLWGDVHLMLMLLMLIMLLLLRMLVR